MNNNDLEFLPETLGNMKSLRILNVSGNQLRELPPSIVTLPNLRELIIDRRFTNFPDHFDRLENLHIEFILPKPKSS